MKNWRTSTWPWVFFAVLQSGQETCGSIAGASAVNTRCIKMPICQNLSPSNTNEPAFPFAIIIIFGPNLCKPKDNGEYHVGLTRAAFLYDKQRSQTLKIPFISLNWRVIEMFRDCIPVYVIFHPFDYLLIQTGMMRRDRGVVSPFGCAFMAECGRVWRDKQKWCVRLGNLSPPRHLFLWGHKLDIHQTLFFFNVSLIIRHCRHCREWCDGGLSPSRAEPTALLAALPATAVVVHRIFGKINANDNVRMQFAVYFRVVNLEQCVNGAVADRNDVKHILWHLISYF